MLEELFATIYDEDNNYNDYHPAFNSLRVSRVEWQEEELALWLDVLYYDENDLIDVEESDDSRAVQRWLVNCSGVRQHRFSLGHHFNIELTDDHVLLMPHVTRRAILSFHGRTDNVNSVIGALCERHKRVAGMWMPFGEHLHSMPLTKLLEGGFGMLAEGPEPLLAAYKEVLEQHGISASHHSSEPSVRSHDEKWIEETARLHVLVLGDSYVVAADFRVERV